MPKKLTPDEVAQALEGNGEVVLLDVRDSAQVAEKGSIAGHRNIPLKELEQRLSELPHNKPVITACNRGGSAGRAANLLEQHGFNVLGSAGVEEWKDQGKPVVYRGKR